MAKPFRGVNVDVAKSVPDWGALYAADRSGGHAECAVYRA
jgi:hypothetical protein